MIYAVYLVSSLSLGIVTAQIMATLFGYSVRPGRAGALLMLLINTVASMTVLLPSDMFPFAARLVILICCLMIRFFTYSAVFMKLRLNIFYACMLSYVTCSTYNIIFSLFIPDELVCAVVSFWFEAVLLFLIMRHIKKRSDREMLVRSIISTIPAGLCVTVLVFIYAINLFTYAAMNAAENSFYQRLSLIMICPIIFLVTFIVIRMVRISTLEIQQTQISRLLSKQLEDQVEHYESIQQVYSELRSFRHDLRNHLICLRTLINGNDMQRASEYIDELEKMQLTVNKGFDTGNVIADALLSVKNGKAAGINARIVFTGSVPQYGIANADLCVILANALDNAIEACEKEPRETVKTITVDAEHSHGCFFLTISNPVSEKIDIKNGNQVTTSKEDRFCHGFGVANIVRTSAKYGGNTRLSSSDGRFVAEVELFLGQEKDISGNITIN